MNISLRTLIAGLFAAVVGALAANLPAQRAETIYAPPPPRAETPYTVPSRAAESQDLHYGAIPGFPLPPTETGYNPRGTHSPSHIALLSPRREEPEFTGFLLGIQGAAIELTGGPLNVAPLSASPLEDQYKLLRERGATVFLLDAPQRGQAADFLRNAAFLEIELGIITQELTGFAARFPTVVYPAPYTAELSAKEIIRILGDGEKTVGYVKPSPAPGKGDAESFQQLVTAFERPFLPINLRQPEPGFSVVPVDLDKPAEEQPTLDAIAALTPGDSARLLQVARRYFPQAKVVLTGESVTLRRAFDQGRFDVRIHPDYHGLMTQILAELEEKSSAQPTVLPVAQTRPIREQDPAPGTAP